MSHKNIAVLSLGLGVALLTSGCVPEEDEDLNPFGSGGITGVDTGTDSGDGDGDPTTTTATGDGDGDDPTTTGDGDGDDPTTTGDGDGDDPTTTGDGDGDPTGDGDGDCNGDSPYMGGWDIGCCQDSIAQNGWAPGGIGPGSVLPDWTFTDQHGDSVRIYDFCHEAIYFEYVALW